MNDSPMILIKDNAENAAAAVLKILEECNNHSDQVALAAFEALMVLGKAGNTSISNCTFTNKILEKDDEAA